MNGQYIETKFFFLLLPIFPIESKLILKKESFNKKYGIDIPINYTSVLAGYARVFLFLPAAGFLYSGLFAYTPSSLLPGLIFTALWVYFAFIFGRTTEAEKEQRSRMGKATGLYAMPEWLYSNYVENYYDKLKVQYDALYQSNWKEDLMKKDPDPARYPILYGLALFNYMIHELPEHEVYYNKAYALLD